LPSYSARDAERTHSRAPAAGRHRTGEPVAERQAITIGVAAMPLNRDDVTLV
jgi:hypothetical protein